MSDKRRKDLEDQLNDYYKNLRELEQIKLFITNDPIERQRVSRAIQQTKEEIQKVEQELQTLTALDELTLPNLTNVTSSSANSGASRETKAILNSQDSISRRKDLEDQLNGAYEVLGELEQIKLFITNDPIERQRVSRAIQQTKEGIQKVEQELQNL